MRNTDQTHFAGEAFFDAAVTVVLVTLVVDCTTFALLGAVLADFTDFLTSTFFGLSASLGADYIRKT